MSEIIEPGLALFRNVFGIRFEEETKCRGSPRECMYEREKSLEEQKGRLSLTTSFLPKPYLHTSQTRTPNYLRAGNGEPIYPVLFWRTKIASS